MGYYGYRRGTDWGLVFSVGFVVVFCLFVLVTCSGWWANTISDDQALARIKELAGTNNVQVVRQSNSNPVFGDSHDVTYELLVDGKAKSARCTSGEFSAMICRLYGDGGE